MKAVCMRSFVQRAVTGLICCALLLPGAAAVAADDAALVHTKRARIAYDLRDWATAIHEYRSAYAAEPKPETLFGLAQALRQNHEYAAAIYTFKAYKRLQGISPQQAAAADLLIAKCEAEQADIAARAAARPPAPVPVDAPLRKDGEATLPRAQRLAAAPARDTQRETTSARPGAFYGDVLGDSLFIAGLAGAGVGTWLLINGNSAMKDVPAEPTDRAARVAEDSAHRRQVTGVVLLPVGGVLIVGAIWRWVSVREDAREESGSMSLGPNYIGYSGRF
jgi:hypothetical protein